MADLGSTALAPAEVGSKPAVRRRYGHQIPPEITENAQLKIAMQAIPSNYNFEVPKTLWRIQQAKATRVALQFPEGLLMYACTLSDIISEFTGAETVIMGDVTYGACCVDDLSARALGCELLVHYGHSCLVPVDTSAIAVLYVFVEIGIDVDHFVQTVTSNVPHASKLALLGTVQFLKAIHAAKPQLASTFAAVGVPQAKPLSPGETLGCTAPRLKAGEADFMVFLADGRFHPEAAMIHNPEVPLLRYDPYARLLTREDYDHARMLEMRQQAVRAARAARCFGLVLGTLGRQGNPAILDHLRALLTALGIPHIVVLLSELFPAKLSMFAGVDAWVQVACPRLSIDWGHGFTVPVLTTYEAEVALGAREWQSVYPMSYYAREGGSFANYAPDEERAATRDACLCKRGLAETGDTAGSPGVESSCCTAPC